MSKFSSYKQSQLLFENWRGHVKEVSDTVMDTLAGMSDDEKREAEAVLDSDDSQETLQEDGHTDVASAMRKMKVSIENAEQLLQALSQMPPEGDLPSWWMSKATLAANYISKMRDYLLLSSDE